MRSRHSSPLRYPGGKARWADEVVGMLGDAEVLIEPFAGGLGCGLELLRRDEIEELWFAEANRALAAFWVAAIDDAERLAQDVARVRPDLEVFGAARAVLDDPAASGRDLALAAFIVNRMSRSGIIHPKAGPIGGKSQAGYTVAARFDPERLGERIAALAPYATRMRFLGHDGVEALSELDGSLGLESEVFVFADPPYVAAGPRLYASSFEHADHRRLAETLHGCGADWLATYDEHPLIRELYDGDVIVGRDVRYTAAASRRTNELLIRPST